MTGHPAAGSPFGYLPAAPEHFVDRWPYIDDVARELLSATGDSYALIGGRRFGKTSFLNALEDRLRHGSSAICDHRPLVVSISFESLELASATAFFSHVLMRVLDQFEPGRSGGAVARPPLDQGLLAQLCARLESKPALVHFEQAIAHIFDRLELVHGPTRLVLLLDEMDCALDYEWHVPLFRQLRTCISGGPFTGRVRLVAAGSRQFLNAVKVPGSPMLNQLKRCQLRSLNRADVDAMCSRCPGLPAAARGEIWRQCGGHPLLARYLLRHLWGAGCAGATERDVESLAHRFLNDHHDDLVGWASALGTSALRLYDHAVDRSDWIDEMDLIKTSDPPSTDVRGDLMALCYHGFLEPADDWSRYRRTGQLLRSWHLERRQAADDATDDPPNAGRGGDVILQPGAIFSTGGWQVGDHIEIKDVSNSIIPIKSELQHVSQTIGGMDAADGAKQELSRLVEALGEALAQAPADRRKDAATLTNRVKAVVDELASAEPDSGIVESNLGSIRKIADALASVVPAAARIATEITTQVADLMS